MEKRLIIAIALSFLVLLAFQFMGGKKKTQFAPAPISPVTKNAGTQASAALPQETAQRPEQSLKTEKGTETTIAAGEYEMVFSDIGGSVKKISVGEDLLFREEDPAKKLFAMENNLIPDLSGQKFTKNEGPDFLEYEFTEQGWITITKRFTFHKAFNYINLQVSAKNLSSRKIAFSYRMTGPSALEKAGQVIGRSFLEADIKVNDKIWKAKSVKQPQEKTGAISWAALKNRYFTLMLKPEASPGSVTVAQAPSKELAIYVNSQQYELVPGETVRNNYVFYAGPLDETKLQAGGYGMDEIIDYGSVSYTHLTLPTN